MADASDNLNEVLTYGKGGRYLWLLPFAIIFLLLGLFILQMDERDEMLPRAFISIALGGGFLLFVLWRQFNPGPPGLALSPEGIRLYTVGHTFVIPWDEVQSVERADIQSSHGRITATERGVPVVLVSADFYRTRIHLASPQQRGRSWQYQFIPRGDLVQVGFFPMVYAQTGAALHRAIEKRWRAFSKHPNAKAPSVSMAEKPG